MRESGVPSFGIRLGKMVAEFRAANEMSQKDLAIAAFNDEAQRYWVSKLEGGRVHRPHERKVDALRLALGIPLETIDEIRDPSEREAALLETEEKLARYTASLNEGLAKRGSVRILPLRPQEPVTAKSLAEYKEQLKKAKPPRTYVLDDDGNLVQPGHKLKDL